MVALNALRLVAAAATVAAIAYQYAERMDRSRRRSTPRRRG